MIIETIHQPKGGGGGQVVSVLAFYSEFESRWSLQFFFL